MTQKYFFQIFSIWVSKNAEFYADFESVKNVAKKCTQRKKLQGWELLYTVLKVEKVHNMYILMLITFFCRNFLTLFSTDLKSASNSAFFDTHFKMLWKKHIWACISTFCQLWNLTHTNGLFSPSDSAPLLLPLRLRPLRIYPSDSAALPPYCAKGHKLWLTQDSNSNFRVNTTITTS